jgi:signal transduction histidine kinase
MVGITLSFRITKPVDILSQEAREITLGNLPSPLILKGNDELSELSKAFNEMTIELKRLDATKKQVIADSAHELRTPVTLIQGTIEGMIDGILPLNEESLDSVLEEVLRLSKLIDTLRELEIIDAGELKLSIEAVNLRTLISKTLPLFIPVASEKHISISLVKTSGKDPIVLADYLRLREVLDNLITNAIKYTPKGGKIRIQEEQGPKGYIRFSVDDTGAGIPEEERPLIFDRFYRIDKSRSSDSGGRGLGLSITSEIVKAHGGTITVGKSDLKGASFKVTLPKKKNQGKILRLGKKHS